MHVFCIFVFAPVQYNWACFTWKDALEICSLLLSGVTPINLKFATPVVTLPGPWHYSVSSGTGWRDVSETERLIFSFYLSVAARTTRWADPTAKCTSHTTSHGGQASQFQTDFWWVFFSFSFSVCNLTVVAEGNCGHVQPEGILLTPLPLLQPGSPTLL